MRQLVLSRLDKLARNLWWTWNSTAQRLFASIDPVLWEATHHNPIKVMKLLSPERPDVIATDADFARRLSDCEKELARYLKSQTWFAREFGGKSPRLLVAYFCAEYGVH